MCLTANGLTWMAGLLEKAGGFTIHAQDADGNDVGEGEVTLAAVDKSVSLVGQFNSISDGADTFIIRQNGGDFAQFNTLPIRLGNTGTLQVKYLLTLGG